MQRELYICEKVLPRLIEQVEQNDVIKLRGGTENGSHPGRCNGLHRPCQQPPLQNKDPYSVYRHVVHYGKRTFVLHEKGLLDELNLYQCAPMLIYCIYEIDKNDPFAPNLK